MPVVAPAQGKAPERRTTARKPAAHAPQTTSSRRETREAALSDAGDMLALGLMMLKQPADAGALSQHSPAIAHEMAMIAETDEKVAAFLDRLTTVGPYAGLMKAVIPLALQLAVNHKRLPADKFTGTMGVMDPKDLEAMVTLKAEKMRAELQREMENARKELAQMNGGASHAAV
jgi:hypothetical protein